MNFQDMEPFWKAARQAVDLYFPPGSRVLSLLHCSENVTFLLTGAADCRPCEVMRVARPGYHTVREIEAEVRWLEELAREGPCAAGVSTAQPVVSLNGSPMVLVNVGGAQFACLVFAYLEGHELNPLTDLCAEEDFAEVGRIAALLHNQTEKWTESRALARPHWDYENMLGQGALFGDWRACKGLNSQEFDCLDWTCHRIKQRLERYGKTEDNYGLIHSDLRAANLLKNGAVIQVIDFDDCGFGWHLYDLAASISFIEEDERVSKWVEAWLEGYRTVRPLGKQDLEMIPSFIMARRIQLLAWLTSHDDSDPVWQFYPGFGEKTLDMARKYLSL